MWTISKYKQYYTHIHLSPLLKHTKPVQKGSIAPLAIFIRIGGASAVLKEKCVRSEQSIAVNELTRPVQATDEISNTCHEGASSIGKKSSNSKKTTIGRKKGVVTATISDHFRNRPRTGNIFYSGFWACKACRTRYMEVGEARSEPSCNRQDFCSTR